MGLTLPASPPATRAASGRLSAGPGGLAAPQRVHLDRRRVAPLGHVPGKGLGAQKRGQAREKGSEATIVLADKGFLCASPYNRSPQFTSSPFLGASASGLL